MWDCIKKFFGCFIFAKNKGNSKMLVSIKGIELLKKFEGCSLKAYQDIKGVWTIGYGHTGTDIKSGLVIDQKNADDLFLADIGKFEIIVQDLAFDPPLKQNQFDALVCLAYNIGKEAFLNSSLLKLIKENADIESIKKDWLEWDYAGHIPEPALENRRNDEFNLYCQ